MHTIYLYTGCHKSGFIFVNLAGTAHLVECCPVDGKVAGTIPSQSTYPGCGFIPCPGQV